MAIVEELLELEDTSTVIVDSGTSPCSFVLKVESVPKQPWWKRSWVKTIATIWVPILGFCWLIVSAVVSHAVKDINQSIEKTVDAKLIPVTGRQDDINSRLHDMEGWRKGV